jgi:hypothetical protein
MRDAEGAAAKAASLSKLRALLCVRNIGPEIAIALDK